ncbi:MAG: peptide ABC transporter substrate-binding protein [Lachnospiraceae bacterium]|jgi:oligopeptide transport system substrate-binding protein
MKKFLALILAGVMALSLTACAACGGKEEEGLKVCISSEPQTIDPALNSAVDGATLLAHLFSGLAKWTKDADGKFVIKADLAEELVAPVDNGDGTFTYTYTIRDSKWSDGKPVTANDFAFAWQRAVSVDLAADYGYMFEVVDGYDSIWGGDEPNPEGKLNVEVVDEKTLKVTVIGDLPYWNELLAFPTFYPVREDVVDNDGAWATDPKTYICNGMYTLSQWEHNSFITLKKNDKHPDADSVTMPVIKFFLSDDANNMLANFKDGEWLLIDDVPTNEIAALKVDYPTEFKVDGQIGTYFVLWNMNVDISPAGKTLTEDEKAEVRSAISLLFDRNYIVENIAQGGQVPASSYVAMGITEPSGEQFYKSAGKGGAPYSGYYDVSKEAMAANTDEAMDILGKYYTVVDGKVTDFPTKVYLYNTSEGHKAIAEYLQSTLANVGIKIELENQEWGTFLETRKVGNYEVARHGWLADYNDAISFLDMWVSGSGNNDAQFGKDGHAAVKIYDLDLNGIGNYTDKITDGTWAETYDLLIKYIKSEKDLEVRNQLMHVAEDMYMSTGAICPLYFYTDLYMVSDSLKGFYSNPLGYKYFMYTEIVK